MHERPPSSGARARATTHPQWEVFVRERRDGPLAHAGSVSAANGEEALAYATELFEWCALDLWVCPAAALERASARPLSIRAVTSDERDDTPTSTARPSRDSSEVSEP
ncbi:Htur_1727 family rSAM-partnered candidate RiPP [Natronobiforma cellulositropha]|uniref:Htur_1727 family rSAM-partnered candidate RiPP n=1 Tax=Natronobiforma cellulositropha TaxID=1679076 RepID=UPI0021D56F58|nr:Htur_1727 family rSAM-partnered candidate RiPP [Natronobiforma cellulositropha]